MSLPAPSLARSTFCGRSPLLLAACGLLSGCYAYRTTEPGALRAGTDVRMRLTREGSSAMAETAGLRLLTLEGSVQDVRSDGSVLVQPADVTTLDGDVIAWRRGTLVVPLQSLESTQHRVLNRRRTAGLAGVIAGVFTGTAVLALRIIRGGGSSQQGGPGTPE